MPDALRAAGFVVELHSAHFEQDVRAEAWIKSVGKRGWVILTKDRHIKSNQIEIEALMASGVPTFTLTTADTTGAQNAATILAAMPTMLQCIRKFKPPFVAGITRAGAVNILMTHAQMIKRI